MKKSIKVTMKEHAPSDKPPKNQPIIDQYLKYS